MPSSRSVHPLVLDASSSERPRAPSWLAPAPGSLRPPSFMPRVDRRPSSLPKLDPSPFSNSGQPLDGVERSVQPERGRKRPSIRPEPIEDAELIMPPRRESVRPPSIQPSRHPSIRPPSIRPSFEAERAALVEAEAAAAASVAEMESARARFAEEAAALAVERARIARLVEGELIELAMMIAETIVHSVDDDALPVALAKEALRLLPGTEHAVLRAGAGAYEAILAEFGEQFEHDGVVVRVHADPSIEGAGCIVETSEVRIDGTVRERLAAVARAIHDERAAT